MGAGLAHIELLVGAEPGRSMFVSRVPVVGEYLAMNGREQAHPLSGKTYRVTSVTHLMQFEVETDQVVAQVWAEDAPDEQSRRRLGRP